MVLLMMLVVVVIRRTYTDTFWCDCLLRVNELCYSTVNMCVTFNVWKLFECRCCWMGMVLLNPMCSLDFFLWQTLTPKRSERLSVKCSTEPTSVSFGLCVCVSLSLSFSPSYSRTVMQTKSCGRGWLKWWLQSAATRYYEKRRENERHYTNRLLLPVFSKKNKKRKVSENGTTN